MTMWDPPLRRAHRPGRLSLCRFRYLWLCRGQQGRSAFMPAWAGKPVSSPRVRETVQRVAVVRAPARVIPACAGNRSKPSVSARCEPCHPRVCGKQRSSWRSEPTWIVPSPRVRGTVMETFRVEPQHRVIPACAGNRGGLVGGGVEGSGHPRVCGEQRIQDFDSPFAMVSSQRVRGTDGDETVEVHVPRVIPACAGNTSRDIAWSWFRTGHPCVCGERVIPACAGSGR